MIIFNSLNLSIARYPAILEKSCDDCCLTKKRNDLANKRKSYTTKIATRKRYTTVKIAINTSMGERFFFFSFFFNNTFWAKLDRAVLQFAIERDCITEETKFWFITARITAANIRTFCLSYVSRLIRPINKW